MKDKIPNSIKHLFECVDDWCDANISCKTYHDSYPLPDVVKALIKAAYIEGVNDTYKKLNK